MKTTIAPKNAKSATQPNGGAAAIPAPTAQAPAAAAKAPPATPVNPPTNGAAPRAPGSTAAPTPAPTAPAALPTGRYNQGHRYGTIRYAAGETLPVDDGAKVKMGLSKKSTNQLIPYIQNHIEMMTGNTNFTTPQPAAADLLALFNAYQDAALTAINLETTLKDATAAREQLRAELTGMMNVRASYVQQTSNGNRQVILSSGLGAKNPPTPVHSLAAPTNLRVDLNGEAGMMKIRWDTVPNAKTYQLQCSRDETPRVWENLHEGTRTLVTKTLELGVTYVFRVAAVGKPGRSNWSPEVIRGAA